MRAPAVSRTLCVAVIPRVMVDTSGAVSAPTVEEVGLSFSGSAALNVCACSKSETAMVQKISQNSVRTSSQR